MKKRLLAMVLSIVMIVSMVPLSVLPVFAADPAAHAAGGVMQNTNQNTGVVFTKSAQPHIDEHGNPDGTVDIVLHAYTTGVVTTTNVVTPTDIVLVLDLSGSMDDRQSSTQQTVYTPVYATETSYDWGIFGSSYHTGLNTNRTRYVMTAPDTYVAARESNEDDNGHEVWYYTDENDSRVYFYPAFEDANFVTEYPYENSYPRIQVYTQSTQTIQGQVKIDLLKAAVDEFIANTAKANEGITDSTKMHRISIVKFASDDYADESNLLDEGNDTFRSGSYTYNYSQLVKNLTVVDEAGKNALISAMDSLNPGGATAVDYGVNIANAVFDAQDEAYMQGRNKVVIVLTDGSPTYSSNYQAAVAGSAINYAKRLKDEGVTVYTISVEDGADTTQLGNSSSNQFMHYLSSNYPSATYADNRITAGTGGPEGGYYLTPGTTQSLDMIFQKISEDIASPTISLGTETTVIDSVSEYFTISDPINGIDVYTADKLAGDAWDEPVLDTSITPVVSGNTVSIDGFDFNANFVSNEKRIVGGQDFYGKTLILVINVTPDYERIDRHAADIYADGGNVATNDGEAEIVKGNVIVTTVNSPEIQLNKITYTVDGENYREVYRLPGGEHTVIAAPTKTGATFSGWESQTAGVDISSGTFTMPQSDVTIAGTFTNINYTVYYEYVGLDLGAAMPALPQSHTAVYGENVTVAATPTLEGYTFVGWYPQDEALGTGSITAFSMPAHNVVLLGRFVPSTGTAYKVEHYTETFTDGEFELRDTENLSGTTGETATAAAKDYEGFTYAANYDDGNGQKTVAVGTIAADGSLVLKLYYKRNSYEVTYEYVGDKVPTGAAPAGTIGTPIASYTQTCKYGADVTVKADATAPGYTFTGWYSTGGTVANDTVSFKMPDHAVTLHGYFSANNNTAYTIEHYFENANDDGYTINNDLTEEFNNATTDTTVTALPLNIQGFKCDTTVPGTVASGTVTGDGELALKLYYKRNTYTVTYDYEGFVPADANPTKAELAGATVTYKWGETVTVYDAVIPPTNYEFHGWYFNGDASRIIINGTDFTMPQEDVLILGHFDATTGIKYYVEHYFWDADANAYVHDASYDEEFTGTSGETVTATPVTVTGYHHNASYLPERATGTVPGPHDGTVLKLELYYDLNRYKVTYKYEGFEPDGASTLPPLEEFLFGTEVPVADAATAKGYTFVGWYRNNDDAKTPITKFDMPAHDVELVGMFVANTDTKYTVEHYFEDADGNYVIDNSKTQTPTATTGTSVTATPLGVEGFTYNVTKSEATRTGTVAGDGSTTLKLYYSRNKFTVTYVYTVAPTGAALPTPHINVPWGDEVTLKAADEIDGYTFSGWSIEGITITGGKFEMPKANVTVIGSYSADDYNYKVEHWVETDNGFELHGASETRVGKMDTPVTAAPHVIHGYTYDADVTVAENAKNGIEIGDGKAIKFGNSERTTLRSVIKDGSLVLAFYYTRNEYDVTYVIEGAVKPEGIEIPAGLVDIGFGTKVEVADALSVPGYTFSGWTTDDAAVEEGEFSMPDNDVVFTGSFTADEVGYTIKYWQQSLDENGEKEYKGKQYNEVVADRIENLKAVTGHTVSAYPDYIKTYEGFDPRVGQDEFYGNVKGDGSLVLNVYYDREVFDVTYIYVGLQPDDAPEIPESYNKTGVMFGAELDVEAKMADYSDRKFDGWHSTDVNITNDAAKFTMPAKNVTIYGRYIPADPNDYTVTYFVDGEQYAQYVVKPGEVHVIIDEPTGNTVFKGWSEPLNIAKNQFVPTTDNEFLMPWSDVEIRGEFEAPIIIPRGTLSITKIIDVPDNFLGTNEYDFNIYSVDGNTMTLVETLTVKGGETESLNLTPGTYYVAEQDANVDGYTLVTECSDADGFVTVAHANETEVTFTNTYTEIMLQMDDHFAYIIGYPDGTVRPEASITRAEVATIFFRMMTDTARNHYWSTTNSFSDVKEGDWYNTAISTLANAGVLNGYTDGTFHPNATITRAELVTIATAFYDTAAGKSSEFSDVRDHWAATFIDEAQKLGIVDGYGDGTFHPDQAVTRAEAMKIVNRTLNRRPDKDHLLDSMIKWPDNMDTSKWYYAEVQEATNSHDYTNEDPYEIWTAILPVRDWAKLELAWKEEHDGE